MITNEKWRFYLFLLITVLAYFVVPNTVPPLGRGLIAIFVFGFLFWVFEVIPLYATSLWIVLLLTLVFSDYTLFFTGFANPLIFLFLGGLVLASAIRKHNIDEFLLMKMMKTVGTNPYAILGCALFMSAFFSMWVSNTAAAAMMLPLYQPLLQQLAKSDPLRKSLPLSIACGCNIGGIGTPIGTPPNAIVIGILRETGTSVNFLDWMLMAIPLVIVILICVFFVLTLFFPPKKKEVLLELQKNVSLTVKGKKTCGIAFLMIFLWLTNSWHQISEAWIALAGVGVFASLRLITVEDLKKIDWDVLILMWGGLALGMGIEKSQILTPYLPYVGKFQDFFIIAVFSLAALFLSTFISNTAAANLLLPFAVQIASVEMSLIAIPVALACSFAMALPISTPPNALAYSYGALRSKDLYKTGSIIGIISLILVLIGFDWVIPWFLKT